MHTPCRFGHKHAKGGLPILFSTKESMASRKRKVENLENSRAVCLRRPGSCREIQPVLITYVNTNGIKIIAGLLAPDVVNLLPGMSLLHDIALATWHHGVRSVRSYG